MCDGCRAYRTHITLRILSCCLEMGEPSSTTRQEAFELRWQYSELHSFTCCIVFPCIDADRQSPTLDDVSVTALGSDFGFRRWCTETVCAADSPSTRQLKT